MRADCSPCALSPAGGAWAASGHGQGGRSHMATPPSASGGAGSLQRGLFLPAVCLGEGGWGPSSCAGIFN